MTEALGPYRSPKDWLEAARSLDTSPAELRRLARAPWDFVLTAVARNPNTEPDVLASLVPDDLNSWNEQDRAGGIASNPNTPVHVLVLLADRLRCVLDNNYGHTMGFQAGLELCANEKTPISAIVALLGCNVAMQFRKVLARESCRRDVVELLLNDRSATVRKTAVKTLQESACGIKRVAQPADEPDEDEHFDARGLSARRYAGRGRAPGKRGSDP